jgi:hypothetical protein
MTDSDDSGSFLNPVALLAEEFLERRRNGELPSIEDYVAAHPDHAEEIRELFPAWIMMNELGAHSDASGGDESSNGIPDPALPFERLGDYRLGSEGAGRS